MPIVEMYIKPTCPYCIRASQLFAEKSISVQEIDIAANPELRSTMIERSAGVTTVPQIFIDKQHIGGCDDLYALERQGNLDELLAKR